MKTNRSFLSCMAMLLGIGGGFISSPLLLRAAPRAHEQDSTAPANEVRFSVAHAHKNSSWCMGYLYISHDKIRYAVVRPDKSKNHSFEIPRSALKSIGKWVPTESTAPATEIKTNDAVYHFWWMPNEDDLQPGNPSRFKPNDAAAPATLINALRHPATVLGGKSESAKHEEGDATLIGTWSGQHSHAKFTLVLNSDNTGSLNSLQVHWKISGKTLTLASSKGTYRYGILVSADSLSLTGNDLKEPMVLERADHNKLPGLFTPEAKADPELPIPGNPPLTQALVDQGIQFFEWLLDAPLTQEQRVQFRDSLVGSWKGHRQNEIDSTMNVFKFQEQLNSRSPEEREIVRASLCQKFLEGMRQTPNEVLSKWILNIYDSAHKPIAKGNPPLTSQVADAYAEVVAFMIRECLGKQALNANRQFKDMLAKSLAAQYSGYSNDQQKQFSQMPVLWKVLRSKWPQLSKPEKQEFRKQWTPAAQNLLASVSGQTSSTQEQDSSDGCSSPELSCSSEYSEHQFVKNMASSSFASTISLHMSVFR